MATKYETTQKNTKWTGLIIRLLSAAALAWLGLSWPDIFAGKSAWVEAYYSETVYQAIRRGISAVTRLVPFSIAEFLLYGLAIGAAALVLTRLIQLLSKKGSFRKLAGSVVSLLLTASVILNLFYVTWGFNYFRAPLWQRMNLTIVARPVDELESFVLETAKEARALRAALHESEDGVFSPIETTTELFNRLPQAYAALSVDLPMLQSDPTRAKQVFWSRGLSWQGISGIYIGITAEPNVNVNQPHLLLYQAAAHEMAHQLGIASENEAEFVAYLACLRSSDPNIRYSGLIYALIVSGNALYRADSQRYLAATETYGDAIWRDFVAYNTYWDAFDGEVRESADKRNDAYLKHNAQPSGILSYGESVDLLLAYADAYGNGG